jgi:hypothetical protein
MRSSKPQKIPTLFHNKKTINKKRSPTVKSDRTHKNQEDYIMSRKAKIKAASIAYCLEEEGLYLDSKGNISFDDYSSFEKPWELSAEDIKAVLAAKGQVDWEKVREMLLGKSYVSLYVAGKLFSYSGTSIEAVRQIPVWIKEGVARSRVARGMRQFPREEIKKMDVTVSSLSSRFLQLTKDWEVHRFLGLYQHLYVVGRPWGSHYQPNQIKIKVIALTPNYNRLPLWVKEVLIKSPQWIQTERVGDIWKLIPAARAWKICPDLPKAIAVRVGKMPLWKRLAAAGAWNSLQSDWQYFCYKRREEGEAKNVSEKLWMLPENEEERGFFLRGEVMLEFWKRFNLLCKQDVDAALVASGDLPRAIAIKYPQISGEAARFLIALLRKIVNTDEERVAIAVQMNIEVFCELIQPKLDEYKNYQKFSFTTASAWVSDSWEYKSLLSLAIVFGSRCHQWLETRGELSNYLTDGMHWLPVAPPQDLEGLGDWLFAHSHLSGDELKVVADEWQHLAPEKRALPQLWKVIEDEKMEVQRKAQKAWSLRNYKQETCQSCGFYSGELVLPCAVNIAFNEDPDCEICLDWESK